MAGYVVYSVLPNIEEETLSEQWIELVRHKGWAQGVSLPAHIKGSGFRGSWLSMNYTSNEHLRLVKDAAAELGMTYLRGCHNGKQV